jgi:hypothetical protein
LFYNGGDQNRQYSKELGNMSQPLGNEAQMDEVRKAMALAGQVRQGGDLTKGVHIEFTSLEGNKYSGWVEFKKPTMSDFMRMGAIKSEVFRAAGVKDLNLVDESIKFMAHTMSTLEVVIAKRPEWLLNVQAVTEPEVLYHILGKYNEWEDAFRQDFRNTSAPDSEGAEGAETVDTSEARI